MLVAGRWLGVGALVALSACHSYVRVDAATPPAGEILAFHIGDEGRVALRERLGPGVSRIEGRLVGTESDVLLVSVASIEHLNGTNTQWSGEVMRLDRGLVAHLEQREFSTTRTLLLVGGVTTAVVVFIASRGFSAIFGDDDGGGSEPPPAEKIGRPYRP